MAKAWTGEKLVCVNRKARFEYEILETFEGGLVLKGTEVKSLRAGQASITEGFAVITGGEAWLVDCQIQPYAFGNLNNHEPKRKRKILLHKREIAKLTGKIKERGLSLIPLKIYFKNGMAKVDSASGAAEDPRQARDNQEPRRAARGPARNTRPRQVGAGLVPARHPPPGIVLAQSLPRAYIRPVLKTSPTWGRNGFDRDS